MTLFYFVTTESKRIMQERDLNNTKQIPVGNRSFAVNFRRRWVTNFLLAIPLSFSIVITLKGIYCDVPKKLRRFVKLKLTVTHLSSVEPPNDDL